MISYLTYHNPSSSSVAQHCRKHSKKPIFSSKLPSLGPTSHHGHQASKWESNAESRTGKFRLSSRSVPRPCFPSPHWRTSTSTSTHSFNQIGKTTSRTYNGWNYYSHLLL